MKKIDRLIQETQAEIDILEKKRRDVLEKLRLFQIQKEQLTKAQLIFSIDELFFVKSETKSSDA